MPAAETVWKSSSEQTIVWSVSSITPVTIEFSDDNSNSWKTVAEKIENMGQYNWGVPAIESEKCILRIKSSQNDSILGQSAVFQVNKFGVVIKKGELIVNGMFSQQHQNWTLSKSPNIQCEGKVQDEVYGISISEPGSNLESIILSQADLILLGGKEYILSFSCFATGNRDMGIKFYTMDDSARFLDTIITLPASMESKSITFTPDRDAVTSMQFCMGRSRAGIYLDNVSLRTVDNRQEIYRAG